MVFVVSGKELPQVSEFFGNFKVSILICLFCFILNDLYLAHQGLGLGAEHGFYYRWPREEAGHHLHDCGESVVIDCQLKWCLFVLFL